MAMGINTGILSLTAQRNLSANQSTFAVAIQRLSSGLRINSARDDAAGLAISERFTSQIRGQNQAIRIANDGISMLQTADGATSTIASNLQRIRELSVQAANSTNSTSDRQALQREVSQLAAEIDRISVSTEFNGEKVFSQARNKVTGLADVNKDAVIEGLQGGWLENAEKMIREQFGISGNGQAISIDLSSFTDGAGNTAARVVSSTTGTGQGTNITLQIDMADFVPPNLPNGGNSPFYADRIIAHEMVHAVMATSASWGELATGPSSTWFTEGTAEFIHGADERVAADIAANGGGGVAGAGGTAVATNIGSGAWGGNSLAYSSAYVGVRYLDYTIKSRGGKGVQDMIKYLHDNAGKTLDDAFANASSGAFASNAAFLANITAGGSQTYMQNVMNDAMLANADTGAAGGADASPSDGVQKTATGVVFDFGLRSGTHVLSGFNETWEVLGKAGGNGNFKSFQVGANAGQTIQTDIGGMNLGSLGLTDVDVTTADTASLAIRHVDKALDYVNSTRAKLGAQMSRFETTVKNLQVSSENMTASRSRITDADFAQETAALSRAQILQQAGTAMVAQANQMPRMVLALLR